MRRTATAELNRMRSAYETHRTGGNDRRFMASIDALVANADQFRECQIRSGQYAEAYGMSGDELDAHQNAWDERYPNGRQYQVGGMIVTVSLRHIIGSTKAQWDIEWEKAHGYCPYDKDLVKWVTVFVARRAGVEAFRGTSVYSLLSDDLHYDLLRVLKEAS